jgi:hypothetical protein
MGQSGMRRLPLASRAGDRNVIVFPALARWALLSRLFRRLMAKLGRIVEPVFTLT